jgi:hypothetical protein
MLWVKSTFSLSLIGWERDGLGEGRDSGGEGDIENPPFKFFCGSRSSSESGVNAPGGIFGLVSSVKRLGFVPFTEDVPNTENENWDVGTFSARVTSADGAVSE